MQRHTTALAVGDASLHQDHICVMVTVFVSVGLGAKPTQHPGLLGFPGACPARSRVPHSGTTEPAAHGRTAAWWPLALSTCQHLLRAECPATHPTVGRHHLESTPGEGSQPEPPVSASVYGKCPERQMNRDRGTRGCQGLGGLRGVQGSLMG